VFFTARGTTTGNELWVTDGTEAGTVMLKSFLAVAGQSRRAENFVDLGGTLLFRATGPNNEAEIWKSDGTPQGTLLVRRFAPYSGLPGGTPLVRAGGFVYFVAAEPETRFNNELWKTDGTDGGTVRVKDINPGTDFASNPEHLLAAGNRVYFSAFDRTAGAELWVSDGTEIGTTRVADLRFDFGSSGAIPWTAVGNRVYFTADDGATGWELYSTDGTPAGTALVDDVNPGPIGSGARWPTAVGGNIVFWADDGIHGAEPMAAPLAGSPPAAVVGRHVFYNDSAFDGSNPAPNAADDDALATDKTALRPGQAASFANVTGYTRGINGLMIDFSGDLPLTALAGIAATLELKAGATGDPSQWLDAPGPSQITIRKGAGVGGSDRVTLVWYDGSIRNAWLRVTVRALPQSGLSADDTFTFGNLVGETGDSGANLTVSARDVLDTRLNRSPAAVGIGNRFDHNRDGSVNVLDYTVALRNLGRSIAWSPPPQAAGAAPPARPRTAPVRRSVLDAVPADPG
jgi:ELWxxDGT repeat protein